MEIIKEEDTKLISKRFEVESQPSDHFELALVVKQQPYGLMNTPTKLTKVKLTHLSMWWERSYIEVNGKLKAQIVHFRVLHELNHDICGDSGGRIELSHWNGN